MKKILFLLSLIFTTLTTSASHLMGGYIQVMQVGVSDTVNISVTLFTDPQGISMQSITLNEYKLSNGFYQPNGTFTITNPSNGFFQGYNVQVFNTQQILTSGDYRFIYTNCCRGMLSNASSAMNSNFTIGMDYKKNSSGVVPNSAPVLLNFLPSTWTVGTPSQTMMFVFDVDGDSILIEMDDALNQYANGTFVPLAPFSQLSSYGSYSVNTNGLVSWNPNTQGTFGTGYKISEYRNGSLIGVNRIQQVYSVVQGSTPIITNPFNMTFNADSTITIEQDLLNGDSIYVGFTASNITNAQLLIYGVQTTNMGTSTWSIPNLRVGQYEGYLRLYNSNCVIDYPLTLEVTSTIGIEEIIVYRDTRYKVYDWNGRYLGDDIKFLQNGMYVVIYENGQVEKIFLNAR